ncbi:MAG: glycosyltransferase family 39 protein [Elusimicrobia bacterium]|nr:glycosyltransferase family 39 protein [Elusimicrobiota bacterium]
MRGRVARLSLAAAAAGAWWAVFSKAMFAGPESDVKFYMDAARNFARGLGLVTYTADPAQLAFFPPGTNFPIPFLHHGPVAIALLGTGYRLLGEAPWAYLVVGFAFTLLTGLLVYALADALAGEAAALIAAALFWSSYLVMEGVFMAPTDPPFIFFVTASVFCLRRSAEGKPSWRWAAAAGLGLGLASCTRMAAQSYWPGFLAASLWLHGRNWRPTAALLAGTALALAPLAAYNHAAAGVWFYSPGYYVLNWSHAFPGFRARTTFMNLSALEAMRAYPMDFLLKAVTGPLYAVKRFTEAGNGAVLSALMLLGGLAAQTGAAARWRAAALCIALPVLAFNAVISYGAAHYLTPLFPLGAVLAALFLTRFARERLGWPLRRPALAAGLLAGLCLGPTAIDLKDAWKDRPARLERRAVQDQLGAFIRRHTAEGEVIYTDANRLVAWDGGRPAVPLAATPRDAQLAFRHTPPAALLITSLRSDSEDFDPMWRQALARRAPVLGLVPCRQFCAPLAVAVLFRPPARCPRPLPPAALALPPAGAD